MVTSRQFTRGVVRTMRAMDRAAKQAERQRVAHQNALHRQAVLNASAAAAAEYEEIIEGLTGAHRIEFERRDWLTDATAPDVPMPERPDDAEMAAIAELEAYTPNWAARLFGREESTRQKLADAVEAARHRDDRKHAVELATVADENERIAIARKIVERDPDAMVAALERYSELGDLPFSVEGLDTIFIDRRIIAVVDGLDLEDMPEESISLLKSGKASVKALPIGKRQELHRDALCSAALRVALEFLNTLPIDDVEVVMLTDVLDRGSGHIESLPVMHLRVTSQAVETLNLARVDPSALVERLGGHFNWNKKDGFRPVNLAAFGIELPT